MKNSPKAISILGVHRSGTSAITRAINLLGAYLGKDDDLMGPSPDNPEGYWERFDIVALNDHILNGLKRTWDTVIPLPDQWHTLAEVCPMKDRLTELVETHFSDHDLWAWKDPRTSLLLPLWKEVLTQLDIELSCFFVLRNPLDVALSLLKRDGFSYEKSFGIWFNYSISALQATSQIPMVFVSYDIFLANPEAELKRYAEASGIQWPECDIYLLEQLKSFVRQDLCHSSSTLNDLKRAKAPYPVIELYEFLISKLTLPKRADPKPTRTFDRLVKEFNAYSGFYQYDMVRLALANTLAQRRYNWTQVYFDSGLGFNEVQSLRKIIAGNEREIEFDLTGRSDIKSIRFDPMDDMVALHLHQACIQTEKNQTYEVVSFHSNALFQDNNGNHIFSTTDPQIFFDLQAIDKPKRLIIRLDFIAIGTKVHTYISDIIATQLKKKEDQLQQRHQQLCQVEEDKKRLEAGLRQATERLTAFNALITEKDDKLRQSYEEKQLFTTQLAETNERLLMSESLGTQKNEQLSRAEIRLREKEEDVRTIDALLKKREAELRKMAAENTQQEQSLTFLLQEKERLIRDAHDELVAMKQKFDAKCQEVVAKEDELLKLTERYEEERLKEKLARQMDQIKRIYNSLSWKITAPLRKIKTIIKVEPKEGVFDLSRQVFNAQGGFVDTFKYTKESASFVFEASGWAYDPRKMQPAKTVVVVVDYKQIPIAQLKLNTKREDVAKALANNNLINTGWEATFKVDGMEKGKHRFVFYAEVDGNYFLPLFWNGMSSGFREVEVGN